MWISTYFNFNKTHFNSQLKSKRHDCTLHNIHLSRILIKSYEMFTISALKLGTCVCVCADGKSSIPYSFRWDPLWCSCGDWTWDRLNFFDAPTQPIPNPHTAARPCWLWTQRRITPPLLPPSGQSWGHLLQTARNLVRKLFLNVFLMMPNVQFQLWKAAFCLAIEHFEKCSDGSATHVPNSTGVLMWNWAIIYIITHSVSFN